MSAVFALRLKELAVPLFAPATPSSSLLLAACLERLRLLIFVLGLARQAVVKVNLDSITHGLGLQSARVEKGYMSFGEYTAFNVAGES